MVLTREAFFLAFCGMKRSVLGQEREKRCVAPLGQKKKEKFWCR